jgi:hypothetical protein
MSKKIFCIFLFLTHVFFPLEANELPIIIDFNTFDISSLPGYKDFDLEGMNRFYPFNCAKEFAPFFAYLKKTYSIQTAVETGNFNTETTPFLAFLFEKVYTLGIDQSIVKKSTAKLSLYPNIEIIYGYTPDCLHQILPNLQTKPILFYLDSHWQSHWPLLDELDEISETHRDNCIIVIDDFKVPGRPDIPYDSFEQHECSFEYISNSLSKVFSDYKFHYLIPKRLNCRAKFVVIPRKWIKNKE